MGQWVHPRKQIADPANAKPEPANQLQILASRGLPPPPPEGEYNVDINDTKAMVRYAWVELAPEERESLGLSNSAPGQLWVQLSFQRDQVVPYGDPKTCPMVFYSRECLSAERLNKENDEYKRLKAEQPKSGLTDEQIEAQVNRKKVEYFVLTRISDMDTLRVGGDISLTATAGQDRSFNPAVDFQFNSTGGQLFEKITSRNRQSNNIKRHLAIVLDEKVVSGPGLETTI